MARIIGFSDEDIVSASKRLLAGDLVAFPTETVYGLGANALDEAASRKIFAVKGRPSTDPLICHVHSFEQVKELWSCEDPEAVELAAFLGQYFWPGPLTLVLKASSIVAPVVTGGSGFVGVRIPRHDVALKFLRAVNVPVAAPSANTFGHVSPTTAEHVMADLALRDPLLTVIDGGSCAVGIESTVAKVLSGRHVEILRRGQVSVTDLQKALHGSERFSNAVVTIRDNRSKFKVVQEAMDGPGQLLTHYSPSVPAFLISPSSFLLTCQTNDHRVVIATPDGVFVPLAKTIVLDFRDMVASQLPGENGQKGCLAYRNLSVAGSAAEASREVFDALRWTETVDGAEAVIFPLLSEFQESDGTSANEDELLAAVEDRLFRAASGVVVTLRDEDTQ